jgi:hypothetical protein
MDLVEKNYEYLVTLVKDFARNAPSDQTVYFLDADPEMSSIYSEPDFETLAKILIFVSYPEEEGMLVSVGDPSVVILQTSDKTVEIDGRSYRAQIKDMNGFKALQCDAFEIRDVTKAFKGPRQFVAEHLAKSRIAATEFAILWREVGIPRRQIAHNYEIKNGLQIHTVVVPTKTAMKVLARKYLDSKVFFDPKDASKTTKAIVRLTYGQTRKNLKSYMEDVTPFGKVDKKSEKLSEPQYLTTPDGISFLNFIFKTDDKIEGSSEPAFLYDEQNEAKIKIVAIETEKFGSETWRFVYITGILLTLEMGKEVLK